MDKCHLCSKESELFTMHIVEDTGYMIRSYSIFMCYKCYMENLIKTEKGSFIIINNKMYHFDGYANWNLIVWEDDIDKIFNKDYYNVLNKFRELNNHNMEE